MWSSSIMQRLQEHKLFARLSNRQLCNFSEENLGQDRHEVQAVQEWPHTKTVKSIMQFAGLANAFSM